MRAAAITLAPLLAVAATSAPAQAGPAWAPGRLATRLVDVAPAVAACWRAPEGLRLFERLTVTVRFALRADGSLLGEPRAAFADVPPDTSARAVLIAAAVASVRSCTPVALSEGLGRAIAGRIFTIRLTYHGPQGRGA